jgi:hypothetical protein
MERKYPIIGLLGGERQIMGIEEPETEKSQEKTEQFFRIRLVLQ